MSVTSGPEQAESILRMPFDLGERASHTRADAKEDAPDKAIRRLVAWLRRRCTMQVASAFIKTGSTALAPTSAITPEAPAILTTPIPSAQQPSPPSEVGMEPAAMGRRTRNFRATKPHVKRRRR